jgi:2',3'-cyclic-nucleotide 2'-phosphodiesterase (5'-nucleotidase family)
MKKEALLLGIISLVTLDSCSTHYQVADIWRTRIVIDNRYDRQPDEKAFSFLAPYKHQVDSIMGPKVGVTARYMSAKRPEGTLSNLLPDILMWAAKDYGEHPDFGIYNMGGIRADLPSGVVTYGDVLDVAPFENKIAFVTLNGTEVLELFSEIAANYGECVSHGVNLVINRKGKLVSATLNGEAIDPQRDYRITTIDYLLGGSDRMSTFKKGRKVNSPQEKKNNTRFLIIDYFREKQAKGEMVDAQIEGRIKLED